LSLVLTGRTAGTGPTVEVLSTTGGTRLWGCEGDAILSRGGSDKYELTPLLPRFSLRCQVALTSGDRLQLVTTPQVLWIDSQVKDGELIRDEEEGGKQRLSVVHIAKDQAEKALPVSAIGRYHVTLSPEGVGFVYQLLLRNPNRSHQRFAIAPHNGERVQRLDAAISCEQQSGEYGCHVPPGEHTLTLRGSLPATTFKPPLQASVHYLLLDGHPLLRPAVESAVQRISVSETGMNPQYRGAQGFLLDDKQTISWRVVRLEAMRTQSYAVSSAATTFFLGSDGHVLGETTLELDNQGAAELQVPMRADPTYASLQGEPMLLTKNEAGALLLPLSQGAQRVQLQHRQSFSRSVGIGVSTLWLPELPSPAATASIELRYDRDWLPLYEELSPEVRFPAVSVGELIVLLLLLLGAERLLFALGLSTGLRVSIALLFCASAAAVSSFLVLFVLAELLVGGLFVLPWLFGQKRLFWLVVGGLCLGGLWALLLGGLLLGGRSADRPAMAPVASEVSYSRKLASDAGGEAAQPEKPKPPVYQGLPPRETIPWGEHRSYLHRERLLSEGRAVQAVMVWKPAVQLVGTAFFALAVLLLSLRAGIVRMGISGRWRRVLEAKAASEGA
ncbi:MAG TPA: hypothetical protein PK493_15525, partial [Pseudomonadota bacterium]|nr:hypothetical protein [Pseudomonadota bacterium]